MYTEIPLLLLDLVLFPGMPLPLHIFEPRYRLMIRRCLDANRVFGVALPLPRSEEIAPELPMGMGTSTRIIQVFPLPGGRFNLQTNGEQRFRVHSVQIIDDYPVAEVEWVEDAPSEDDLSLLADRVSDMGQKYFYDLAAETGLNLSDQGPIELPSNPYELSMWIAAALPMPAHEKQPLLEQTSTSERLQSLLRYLQRDDLIRRAAFKQGIFPNQPLSWDPRASLN